MHEANIKLGAQKDSLAEKLVSDELTQTGNKRKLSERLEMLISAGTAFAGFFVDLDGFKGINDTYGHEVGDECLIALARQLKLRKNEGIEVYRRSGDEFVVLVMSDLPGKEPSITEEDIPGLTERIRDDIETVDVAVNEKETIRLHASVGGALHQPGQDALDFMKTIDEYSFAAKTLRKCELYDQGSEEFQEGMQAFLNWCRQHDKSPRDAASIAEALLGRNRATTVLGKAVVRATT